MFNLHTKHRMATWQTAIDMILVTVLAVAIVTVWGLLLK